MLGDAGILETKKVKFSEIPKKNSEDHELRWKLHSILKLHVRTSFIFLLIKTRTRKQPHLDPPATKNSMFCVEHGFIPKKAEKAKFNFHVLCSRKSL